MGATMTQHDVRLCDGCGKVRDERHAVSLAHHEARWIDLHAYVAKYGLSSEDLIFSHAYCPDCDTFLRRATGRKPMSEAGALS
jgi:hypothetical protein